MNTVSMHLPEAQLPVPAIFNATVIRPVPVPNQKLVYLCFHLCEQDLSSALASRLTAWGVECLAAGEKCTAYGIAPNDESLLELLESDEEIVSVEWHEPSSGK